MALRPPIFTYSNFVFLETANDVNDNRIKFRLNNKRDDVGNFYTKCWKASQVEPTDSARKAEINMTNIVTDSYDISSFDSDLIVTIPQSGSVPSYMFYEDIDTFYKLKIGVAEAQDAPVYWSDTILIKRSSPISLEATLPDWTPQKEPSVILYNIIKADSCTDTIAQYQITIENELAGVVCFDSGRQPSNKYDKIVQEIYQNFYSFNTNNYIARIKYITNYGQKGELITSISKDAYGSDAQRLDIQAAANEETGINTVNISSKLQTNLDTISCLLFRASSKDNFNNYSYLTSFDIELSTQVINTVKYLDRTIDDAYCYKYVVCYSTGNQSLYAESIPVKNNFENDYLTDENHQLNIKFNKNLSNYKQTFLSSSQTTIGSQYPIIKRAGKNNYKTFQIGGLISYQMESFDTDLLIRGSLSIYTDSYNSQLEWGAEDDAHLIERTPVFHNGDDQFEDWASVVFNENFDELEESETKKERLFRDKVIEFLSSDTIKLFRSATEGNILVSLKDISLTPENGMGRMIYSFSANATEIAPVDDKHLRQFHLIK